MKRVTIIHRWYWKPSHRAGASQVYEVSALHDLTDKQLEEKINKMNAGFRTSTWSIKNDYILSKKADQKRYLQYCLECYYDPYCYDHDSAEYAAKMVAAVKNDYPYFK